MTRPFVELCLVALACRSAAGQPAVAPDGVMNAASYMLPALPYSGIAQGSMFVVFGQDLGPKQLVLATSFPLPVELADTSIQVTVNGTAVQPFMIYSYASQVAAILPSTTPAGRGYLTVTYRGVTSGPVSVRVVKSAPGMFARNQAGSGPAIVQNWVSETEQPMNALTEAAHPGQVEIIWATGLGPITGDDSTYPPVGNLPVNVQVLVGGKSATLQYWGRSPLYAGIDQINFVVPAGVEGCRVPLVVSADGVLSNYTSIAITSSGKMCSDPAGFSADDLGKITANGAAPVGVINLGLVNSLPADSGGTAARTESAGAQFFRRDLQEVLASVGVVEMSTAHGSWLLHGAGIPVAGPDAVAPERPDRPPVPGCRSGAEAGRARRNAADLAFRHRPVLFDAGRRNRCTVSGSRTIHRG